MKTYINPALWNSFSEVQKRALAQNILVEKQGFFSDLDEVAAWACTLGAAAAAVAFTVILLR
jgi:hypothetical protein